MNDKEAFEAKANELGLMLDRSGFRADWYAYSETQMAWQCWQAARAYIAEGWDGCVHEASGGDVDIGASIRTCRLVDVTEAT